MLSVNISGWNLAQTYDFKPEYLTICAKAGIFALAHLEEKKEPDAKTAIETIATYGWVGWWICLRSRGTGICINRELG